jgi:hypothetical protein
MGIGNRFVAAVLRSPLHGLLDGSIDVVRYQGRRSGGTFSTPTQYAACMDGIVILVGRADRKTWWRNFQGGHDLEVLLGGRWVPMVGEAVLGADDPEAIAPLLAAYLRRFPRVARQLPEGSAERAAAVVVRCRPRPASKDPGTTKPPA